MKVLQSLFEVEQPLEFRQHQDIICRENSYADEFAYNVKGAMCTSLSNTVVKRAYFFDDLKLNRVYIISLYIHSFLTA